MKIRWTEIKYYVVRHSDVKQSQTTKKLFSIMSNLQTYHHFKLDFWKVDQHTGGNWLNHSTKQHKDNQLQSLELPSRIS